MLSFLLLRHASFPHAHQRAHQRDWGLRIDQCCENALHISSEMRAAEGAQSLLDGRTYDFLRLRERLVAGRNLLLVLLLASCGCGA